MGHCFSGILDQVADQPITRRYDEDHHQNAKPSARAAFPKQQQYGDDDCRQKIPIATGEWHQRVECGIAQRLIDETQPGDIQLLEPIHGGSLKLISSLGNDACL